MGDSSKSITPATLINIFESPGDPMVLDVRRAAIFEEADDMIHGAVWCDPAALDDWADTLSAEADYVVYCVHGHEVSQNTPPPCGRRPSVRGTAKAGSMHSAPFMAG